ncbi:MAG TPA: hypothetical protein VEA44_15355 [Caulobacter sp.]|nr:hypothetical protein [Caulobacter sp.]
MTSKGKPFTVDTHPTKRVVVESLTRDATVKACIFDLIDNSIDAARDRIFEGLSGDAARDLPDSFAGFRVDLTLNGTGFKIEDNCGGIPVIALRDMVLRFGRVSDHELGIGVFGVGLNRALFKLGKVSHLKTDTGLERAELILRTDEYIANDTDWGLPAEEFASTGVVGTEIEIRQPPAEIAQDYSSPDWVQALFREIGQRYSRFIARRLEIRVNGTLATGNEIPLRENSPFPIQRRYYKTDADVAIYIECGEHAEHLFKGEPGHSDHQNRALTPSYGWSILCNDRAILTSDTSWKTGWDTKFHSEFYGFVGTVSFISTSPSKLPWNTTKTDVDLNNPAYQMALADMRKFAEKWRQFSRRRLQKKNAGQPLAAIPPAKVSPPTPSTPPGGPGTPHVPLTPTKAGPVRKAPVGREDHNALRFILPNDIDELHCPDKLLALVHEAKTLDLGTHSYSGMVLIRMLFEASLATYLVRHKRSEDLDTFAKVHREKALGRPLTAAYIKNFLPKVDEMLAFLEANPDVWGVGKAGYLKHSMGKLASHQPTMNSAAHQPFQTLHRSVAFQIRDDALPVLRHLIEV